MRETETARERERGAFEAFRAWGRSIDLNTASERVLRQASNLTFMIHKKDLDLDQNMPGHQKVCKIVAVRLLLQALGQYVSLSRVQVVTQLR